MFRSSMVIIRELFLYLTNVIFMLKHSVKLRRYIYIYIYIYGAESFVFQVVVQKFKDEDI